jgi:hypothetical protein
VNIAINNRPSAQRCQASSSAYPIKTFKDRDAWIRLLLAVDADALSCTAKIVAIRIALHHNVETEQCNPAIGKLVLGTGMSKSTVLRMLCELEREGWIGIDRSRGRYTNSFELRAPTVSRVTPFNSVSSDTVEGSSTVSAVTPQQCQRWHRNSVTADTQKRERTENRTAKDRVSLGVDVNRKQGRRQEGEHQDEIETFFEAWYRQYPKHAAKATALKAYRAVVTKKLATPDELLAGAMRYAAERSGQEQRYTKHPSTWLNGGCWADEPSRPVGPTIDQDGNPVLQAPGRAQGQAPAFGKQFTEALAAARRLTERGGGQ